MKFNKMKPEIIVNIYLCLKDKKDNNVESSEDSLPTQGENTNIETCKKEDGVNCSPDEKKDTTTTDKYSNVPISLSGIPIYILERP